MRRPAIMKPAAPLIQLSVSDCKHGYISKSRYAIVVYGALFVAQARQDADCIVRRSNVVPAM